MAKNKTSFKKGNDYWRRVAKENRGRPSKYEPEFKEMVIAMGEQGLCLLDIAQEIGVTRETLWNWGNNRPDFFEALTYAREAAQAHWEKYGAGKFESKEFQTHLFTRMMAARFQGDWTSKKEISGPGGGPIRTQNSEGKVNELQGIIGGINQKDDAGPAQVADGSGLSEAGAGSPSEVAVRGPTEPDSAG